MRLWRALGAVLVLAGCQRTPPQKVETAFDPAAAAYVNRQGPARIDGHAFITRADARVMNASGQYVYLVPATPYARERFARLYGGKKFLAASSGAAIEQDADYARFTRRTKAGSSGRFSFENVAAGEYFIATNVQWKDSEESFVTRGGAVYESVTVRGVAGESIDVVVNGL